MRLIDSVLQLLQLLRYAHDSFTAMNKKLGLIRSCEFELPHEVITYLLYSIRFEKSEKCDLDSLFVEFIRIGYNPFRKNVSRQESIMISSVVSIIDKQRLNNGNRSCKVSKKRTS